MQVYVRATSKKELNERIEKKFIIVVNEYTINGDFYHSIYDCPIGTAVKIYSRMVGGNPYATSYGVIAKKKDGTIYVK